MGKKLDVYMPLIVGDWLKGTRGMRADAKGVYLGLLLHQWDHGFLPESLEELALIEPEVVKVWVSIKDKFVVVAPGQIQNLKCEEVREFFKKQRKNGGKGGRPKKEKPEGNPKGNPNNNPKHNLHNGLDLEYESELKNKKERESEFHCPDVPGDDLIFPIDTPAVRDLWALWKEARWHNCGMRYGMFGEQAALKQLEGMSYYEIEATIQQAIAGNWKNLYPDRNGNTDGKGTQRRNPKNGGDSHSNHLNGLMDEFRDQFGDLATNGHVRGDRAAHTEQGSSPPGV